MAAPFPPRAAGHLLLCVRLLSALAHICMHLIIFHIGYALISIYTRQHNKSFWNRALVPIVFVVPKGAELLARRVLQLSGTHLVCGERKIPCVHAIHSRRSCWISLKVRHFFPSHETCAEKLLSTLKTTNFGVVAKIPAFCSPPLRRPFCHAHHCHYYEWWVQHAQRQCLRTSRIKFLAVHW